MIYYIDDNEARGKVFTNILSDKKVIVIPDRLKLVSQLLDSTITPDFIFIHVNTRLLNCKDVMIFICKQAHLRNVKMAVLSEFFTRKDVSLFEKFDNTTCVKITNDAAFSKLVLNKFLLDNNIKPG